LHTNVILRVFTFSIAWNDKQNQVCYTHCDPYISIVFLVLQSIKERGALICRDDIGTSSYSLQSGAAMSQALPAQIRELATRTAGDPSQRNKKNSKGGWVPKTSKEIVTSLLAMRANIQTQALPGSNMQAEYPSGARFSGEVKTRVSTAAKHCASMSKRRLASIFCSVLICHTTSGMLCHLRSIHIIRTPLLLSIHIIRRLWHESHTYHPYALYLGWSYRFPLYISIYPASGVPPQPNCLRKRVW